MVFLGIAQVVMPWKEMSHVVSRTENLADDVAVAVAVAQQPKQLQTDPNPAVPPSSWEL